MCNLGKADVLRLMWAEWDNVGQSPKYVVFAINEYQWATSTNGLPMDYL